MPDTMVLIPKGSFLYGEMRGREAIPYSYFIDRFPVTYAQYEKFITADGYNRESLWSRQGWKWKTQQSVNLPLHWEVLELNKPDHPVVGVSFYEAEAFARWVGKRLPTELEWVKAASGEKKKQSPWGANFDEAMCKNKELEFARTTSVTNNLPRAKSNECQKMSKNIWEWCASWYINEVAGEYVIRGGPSDIIPVGMRFSNRFASYPNYRHHEIGFRLVQEIPNP